jgi:hypothetical protein
LTLHQPVNGAATFLGKANVTDITDPEAPVPLGGNLDLQVTMRDNGTPGELDLLGVTLRTAAGGLLFSSHWTGTATAQRTCGEVTWWCGSAGGLGHERRGRCRGPALRPLKKDRPDLFTTGLDQLRRIPRAHPLGGLPT